MNAQQISRESAEEIVDRLRKGLTEEFDAMALRNDDNTRRQVVVIVGSMVAKERLIQLCLAEGIKGMEGKIEVTPRLDPDLLPRPAMELETLQKFDRTAQWKRERGYGPGKHTRGRLK